MSLSAVLFCTSSTASMLSLSPASGTSKPSHHYHVRFAADQTTQLIGMQTASSSHRRDSTFSNLPSWTNIVTGTYFRGRSFPRSTTQTNNIRNRMKNEYIFFKLISARYVESLLGSGFDLINLEFT
jgi:hypothetical protein